MGLHVQNHTLLYNILAPCHLCVHLVRKGVRTSCGTTGGLRHAWIAPALNKGMSGIPTAPRTFFYLPECPVNLPSLARLQDNWRHQQDLLQYGVNMEAQRRACKGGQSPVCGVWWRVSWQPGHPPRIGPMTVAYPKR